MGLFENLPFKRGATHFGAPGGAVVPTLDDTAAAQYVGREYIHEDETYNTGAWVKVRVCRNDSGIALVPGRLAKVGPAPTAFNLGGSNVAGNQGLGACVGYANVGSSATVGPEKGYVIDELLKYNVPPYDLFYIVVKGPCLAYTSSATADFADCEYHRRRRLPPCRHRRQQSGRDRGQDRRGRLRGHRGQRDCGASRERRGASDVRRGLHPNQYPNLDRGRVWNLGLEMNVDPLGLTPSGATSLPRVFLL